MKAASRPRSSKRPRPSLKTRVDHPRRSESQVQVCRAEALMAMHRLTSFLLRVRKG